MSDQRKEWIEALRHAVAMLSGEPFSSEDIAGRMNSAVRLRSLAITLEKAQEAEAVMFPVSIDDRGTPVTKTMTGSCLILPLTDNGASDD